MAEIERGLWPGNSRNPYLEPPGDTVARYAERAAEAKFRTNMGIGNEAVWSAEVSVWNERAEVIASNQLQLEERTRLRARFQTIYTEVLRNNMRLFASPD